MKCHNILFQSRSICDRNSSIGAKGLWEWGSEPIKLFSWYSRFRDGRDVVENDESGWLPKSTRIGVNIASIADLVKNDLRIASRMIVESLNIPKSLVLRILKEDLGKRKLCGRFVSHSLTSELREDRVTSWQDIVAMADADRFFFKQNYCGRWDVVFCLWPRNKATEFWMGWWGIPSTEETEIPKVPLQENVNNFFFDSQDAVHK